jgi:glycerol-3-phosphate dehydrogenase
VLATVRTAWQAGAVCVNYARVAGLLPAGDGGRPRGARVVDLLSGREAEVRALQVINATGPWSDRTAALAGESRPRLRLTRGAHVMVPRIARSALLLPTRDGRVLFVLPAGDHSILGTTDTDHRGTIDDVAATTGDVRFLLEEAARMLPHATGLEPGAVVSSWAALRPLVAREGAPGAVSREHRIEAGPSGVLHVVGGKLTSFRSLASEVVTRAAALIARPVERPVTDMLPIDGGDVGGDLEEFAAESARVLAARHRLPPEYGRRLAATLGTRVSELSELLAAEPALLGRLCAHHGHLAVEAAYAARAEMAITLSDVLFRRTRIAYGACRGRDCAGAAASAMSTVTGWSRARIDNEVEAFVAESRRLVEPRPEEAGDQD